MKRKLIFLLCAISINLFTSCVKTYKCQCYYRTEPEGNSQSNLFSPQSWLLGDTHEINASSREDAEKQCHEIEDKLNKEGVGFNTIFMNNQSVVLDKKYQCHIIG